MNRDEHLKWAKQRALEAVEMGDLQQAVTSMLLDLDRQKDFTGPGSQIVMNRGMGEILGGSIAVRNWIEGFN